MKQKKPILTNKTPPTKHILSDKIPKKNLADVKGNNRWILSIDGGGIKGILPLRAIKELQQTFAQSNGVVPAITDMFDMFAGTSTGSIIASMLASGKTVDETIALYEDLESRKKIFESNLTFRMFAWPGGALGVIIDTLSALAVLVGISAGLVLALGLAATIASWGLLSIATVAAVTSVASISGIVSGIIVAIKALIVIASTYLSTPTYKKGIRKVLKGFFQDTKLIDLKSDIFITSVDAFRNETTYFTAFNPQRAPESYNIEDKQKMRGMYKDLFVRHAVEASMSASTFFPAYERFLDGGVGSYNNPAAVAAIEALLFSGWDNVSDAKNKEAFGELDALYKKGSTVVWSFGSSQLTEEYDRADLAKEHFVLFWIEHLIGHSFSSTNAQQNYICKNILGKHLKENGNPWIKYRRYDLFLNQDGLSQIGMAPEKIKDLLENKSPSIKDIAKLDAVDADEFDEFNNIAKLFAETLGKNGVNTNFDEEIVEIGKPSLRGADPKVYRDSIIIALNQVGPNDLLGDNNGP